MKPAGVLSSSSPGEWKLAANFHLSRAHRADYSDFANDDVPVLESVCAAPTYHS
jgi:hypothetical protein